MRKILPLAYLGSLEWWREALSEGAVIDVGEHFIKQTSRNRCEIATVAGRMALTAHVVKGASIHKKAVKDMRLDYSKRWPHQHLVAMRSAYKSSPYYDYYAHHFEPILAQHHEFLYDLTRALAEKVVEVEGFAQRLNFSEEYVRAEAGDLDLRGHDFLGPRGDDEHYWQVFSERREFESNCSILDHLYCEGRLK